jgi:hypothetical protein
MPKIGILFDIDDLGSGFYGYAAYKIFFNAVDTSNLSGCTLRDGDTRATLSGRANQYCIAVDAPDVSKISAVKRAISKSNEKGLLPLSSRFLDEALVSHEPLVVATGINSAGELVGCNTGWVTEAWQESRKKHKG